MRGEIKKHKTEWWIASLCALVSLPFLVDYFRVLQRREYYQLWAVYVLVILYIMVKRWREAPPATLKPPRWAIGLPLVLALPVLIFAYLFYAPWVAMVAFLLLLVAGVVNLSRYRKIEGLLGIWGLTIFLLRPPDQLEKRLLVWMENMSAETASLLLDYWSVLHSVQGNILALAKHDFKIDVICSGWISVISSLAIAGVIAVVRKRSFLQMVTLLLLTFVMTWIVNVLRILVVVSVYIWCKVDLLGDGYMLVYQLGSFIVLLVLILSADAFVVFVWGSLKSDDREDRVLAVKEGWLAKTWDKLSLFKMENWLYRFSNAQSKNFPNWQSIALSVILIAMLILEIVVMSFRSQINSRTFMYGEKSLSKVHQDAVVFDRPGWQLVEYNEEKRDFADIWGALSSIWRLKYHGIPVVMSLDYPFDNWHDVKACYHKIGWKIMKEKTIDKKPEFQWEASQTNMLLPNGDYGFILCSHCDHIGNTVQPKPAEHGVKMALYRLRLEQMTPPFGYWSKDRRTFYQTQCMVATPIELDEATKEEIRLMYAEFREQTRLAIARKSKERKKRSNDD